jgi:hypothetical protein|tara:strand:- start:1785 stop:3227 length:1443 start_codon:yes stop_codon:yes gene_type:complete
MAMQRISFSEWLPDQPGLSGALTTASNVVSQSIGYGPLPLPVSIAASADETLYTLHTTQNAAGTTLLFAGGTTKVYQVSPVGAFTNVSGTTYATPVKNRIRFTQFGRSTVFANDADKIQYFDSGSSTAFADVAADAPIARYITVVRDFVVVANELVSSVRKPSRVRWSGINDETTWAFSQTTQSDFQEIPDGGNIVGITGGEFGLILMDNAIVRMSYIGTPFVFQFDNISRGIGCFEENTVAQYQGITFFLSADGFYMCDGQQVTPIGSEKVDRHFFATLTLSEIHTMSTAIDPIRKLVVWSYPTVGNKRKLLIYNFKTGRWTSADAVVDYLSDASTGDITLEQLDSISGSLDDLGQSLDSSAFIGGQHFLGGTKNADIFSFTGLPRTGLIQTGDIDVGAASMVKLAMPQIDNGSASVAVASRNRLDVEVVYPAAVAASDENRVSLRSQGRYHRISVTPTGDNWKNAIAVDVDIVPTGGR